MSSIGSATASQYELPVWTPLSHTILASVSATPAASGAACPTRAVMRGMANATAKLTTVIGKNATPAANALNPSTACRYWVV
ncbi:MAG TPA: hypothetical protein VMV17_21085 [Streptosporangiaceae bacterium]|nr:hypothetical protein [Streptosporangiaceae bacterium]